MQKILQQIKQTISYILINFCELTSMTSHIKFYRNLRVVGISASVALAAFMTLAVYPITFKGNVAEATGLILETELAMTSINNSANLNLVPRDTNGTFAYSSETEVAKFNITTNNYTGYTLAIVASDDNGKLTNTSTSASFASVPIPTDAYTFTNGSGAAYNGKWGYKPSKYNSVDNTNFLPSPTTEASTIDVTDSANSESNSYTIALGARVDYSTPIGVYTSTFTLAAVGNPVTYTVAFDETSGDAGITDMPATLSDATQDSDVALPITIPNRPYYTFGGWCDIETTNESDGSTVCPTGATIYPASTATTPSYFGIDLTTETNTTLYAIWTLSAYDIIIKTSDGISKVTLNGQECMSVDGCVVEALTAGQSYELIAEVDAGYSFVSWNVGDNGTVAANSPNTTYTVGAGESIIVPTASKEYLQDFTTAKCNTISINESSVLLDSRDNQAYKIAKLADGNCWMIDNLNLGAVELDADLTSSDTNISGTVSVNTFNSWKSSSKIVPITTENSSNGLDADEISGSKYGTLYDYCATTAGEICGSSAADATSDICPKGWEIPHEKSNGRGGIFANLTTNYYNSLDLLRAPVSEGGAGFAFAGDRGSGSNSVPRGQGAKGDYWANNWGDGSSSGYRNVLSLNSSSQSYSTTNTDSNYNLNSVRCILKTPIELVSYMQDITTDIVDSTPDYASTRLIDARDNQIYDVAKVNGKLWMARNLGLGCDGSGSTYGANVSVKSLTSADSNVISNWATPTVLLTSDEGKASKDTPSIMCNSTYGAFYNYVAATAGTITDGASDSTYDVCPKGWRLPKATDAYTVRGSGLNYAALGGSSSGGGGYYSFGSYKKESTSSNIAWTSTYGWNYYLSYYGDVGQFNDGSYYVGYNVRCVFGDKGLDASFMQTVTSDMIQNMNDGATDVLIDDRDKLVYTVAKINNKLWMTRNLAIGCYNINSYGNNTEEITRRNLNNTNSNVANRQYSDWYTPNISLTQGGSFDEARMECIKNNTPVKNSFYGALYNYAAVSAGTITGSSNSNNATYDVCPKGWRLPNSSELDSVVLSNTSVFKPVVGGLYGDDGTLQNVNNGYWWSSTASGTVARRALLWNGSSLITTLANRSLGLYARCLYSN